jgi:putative two-component system response regulator
VKGGESLLAVGGRVLAVDDQEENLELLEELLLAEGYEVVLARDGESALSEVERAEPDCIVLDVMMPGMDGFEVCSRLKNDLATQFVPIIMLTALSEVEDKVRGLEAGADDFLNKPLRKEELLARVRSLVRIKRLRDELDTSESIIFTMVRALESKDPRSAGHSERVAASATAVARRLGLPLHEREAVAKGGMLHDIGMLGVPEELLLPGASHEGEAGALRRRHSELGERILLPLRSLASARDVVRHHHERIDGSGYPDGLFGSELSRAAEIVGIANLYDTLVHRQDRSPKDAAELLREEARAGRFHGSYVETFLESGAALVGIKGEAPPDAWSELVPLREISRTGTILVGDDTPQNREMYLEVLGEAGFRIVPACDGEEVLAALAETDVDMVLLDVRMPKLDGFAVCERIKNDPDTQFLPVVLVTAYRERADKDRGVKVGADDFLSLPLNRLELLARVRSLLRLRTYYRDLEDHQSVVLSLASVLEAKDPYTRGHSARVGELACRLAREVGLPEPECELMRMAGLLHDIGKVGIPEWIINKPGKLTDSEFGTIKTHPGHGELLCRPLKTVQAVLPLIRYHHERYDGKGYPDGLSGEQIPLGARVIALADAYDALTSVRSYRRALPLEEALSILGRETGEGHWDPEVFKRLETLLRREGA